MANNYNQNQYGNQGYPPQQQYNNNNQYGNQGGGGNWNPPPNQQQYNNNQYPNNQNNWNPPPNQPQYNMNQGGNNWNPPPNPQQPLNNNNNNYNNQNGGNWQSPPNQQQYNNNNNQGQQTWHNKPKTKVTQKGNMTITETTESGGGKGRSFEYGGPSQLGPGKVSSSGPYQPQTDEEQIDYFRLKLWELSCCCGCGTDHPCLNLWIWAIFWLIIFIFNGLINLIASLARLSGDSSTSTYTVIALLIIIASLCVNCWALYGLFKLKPLAFLVQIIFFVIFLLLVIIGLFVYDITVGFVVMNIIFIVCDIWAIYVFVKVYKWGKWFKSGGNYDPDMMSPP